MQAQWLLVFLNCFQVQISKIVFISIEVFNKDIYFYIIRSNFQCDEIFFSVIFLMNLVAVVYIVLREFLKEQHILT
jgi:hypothetical protein